jgi:hypothetical protein
MSLDGSVIDLSVSMFDWAKFRRTKGAIKLHLLLDHDGYRKRLRITRKRTCRLGARSTQAEFNRSGQRGISAK